MISRKFAIAAVAGLLLVAAGALVWSMRPKPVVAARALPTFDYAQPGSWAARPETQPPAVWEAGWQMDVILLGTDQALATGENAALIKQRTAATKALTARAAAFSQVGPVYAPLIRSASLDADTAAAVAAYLSADNRGRAFVIATDRPLPATLAPALTSDPMLRERFGGVLLYNAEKTVSGLADGLDANAVCSRRYKPGEGCVARIDLRRNGGRSEIAGDTSASDRQTFGFVSWLNENGAKLAEPLGEMEEIEIIEIKKPIEGE